MFCDARMLGWGSGSAGIAAQVPDSFNPGDAPPKTKPGAPGSKSEEASVPSVEVQGLFEKKLSKEEKKALAAKKREEKRKAKEAAAEGDS